jgi:DNA-binding LacI/PurR family transcriptional regulator
MERIFSEATKNFSSVPPDHREIMQKIGTVAIQLSRKALMYLCDKNNVLDETKRKRLANYVEKSLRPSIPDYLRPPRNWGTEQDNAKYRGAAELYRSVSQMSEDGKISYKRALSQDEALLMQWYLEEKSKGEPEWYIYEIGR